MSARAAVQACLTYNDTKNNLNSVITAVAFPKRTSIVFSGVIKRAGANVGTWSLPINLPGSYRTMTLSIPVVSDAVKEDFADRWMNYASELSGLPINLTVL